MLSTERQAVIAEEKEQGLSTSTAQVQELTRKQKEISSLNTKADVMVQRQRQPPSHHTPSPTLPALGCSSVFLLSQHHLYIRAKDIVKLTSPFPTQHVRVFKTYYC